MDSDFERRDMHDIAPVISTYVEDININDDIGDFQPGSQKRDTCILEMHKSNMLISVILKNLNVLFVFLYYFWELKNSRFVHD